MNVRKIDEKRVSLCCGGKRCPELLKTTDHITITDDFGGKVILTHEQADAIQDGLDML